MTSPILPEVGKLIPIAEAARRLNVNEKTIRRAIARGELQSYRLPLDIRRYVDADEVEAMRSLRDQRELPEDGER